MELSKVIKVETEKLIFNNGFISSEHDQDCCESNYLYFNDLKLEDFDGLLFNLENDDFLIEVPGFGIRIKPVNGFPISVPGYGSNNGFYSSNLELVINVNGVTRTKDITDCQDISY